MECRVLPGPDAVYLDHRLLAFEVVGARDVHEWPLLRLPEGDASLKDVVGVRGDEYAVVASPHPQRGPEPLQAHRACHLELVLSEVEGCGGGQEDLRPGADADRYLELLPALLGHVVDCEQVPGHQPDGDVPGVHDHHPVEGHVLLAVVISDDDPGCDVTAPVLGVVLGYREGHQVHVPGHLPELGVVHDLAGCRRLDGLQDVLHHPVPRDVHCRGRLLPCGEQVPYSPPSVQVLEHHRGGLVR